MSADGREFLVILLGALAIISGIIAMWNIIERDRERQDDAAANIRLRHELQRRGR